MEYGYALQMNQSHMKYMKDEGKKSKKLKTNNGKYTENMFFFVLYDVLFVIIR